MNCCTRSCAAETQFGNARAAGDLERYRRRGADRITRMMLAELRRWPLRGKKLLDLGGGIGVVGWELADSDLAGTTVVEASPAFLDAARRKAEDRSAPRLMDFVLGDFALIADTLPEADVVTLNRVICCYPDAEGCSELRRHMPDNSWCTHTLVIAGTFARLRLSTIGCEAGRATSFAHSSTRLSEWLRCWNVLDSFETQHAELSSGSSMCIAENGYSILTETTRGAPKPFVK